MDISDESIQQAIEKSTKRKFKAKESRPHHVSIAPSKDWLGKKIIDVMDDVRVKKYNVKCTFHVTEIKIQKQSIAESKKEQFNFHSGAFTSYQDYISYLQENEMSMINSLNQADHQYQTEEKRYQGTEFSSATFGTQLSSRSIIQSDNGKN